MNFCKDCTHLLPNKNVSEPLQIRLGYCAVSKKVTINPVTGEEEIEQEYCSVQRVADGPFRCGPSAKFFEARAQ